MDVAIEKKTGSGDQQIELEGSSMSHNAGGYGNIYSLNIHGILTIRKALL